METAIWSIRRAIQDFGGEGDSIGRPAPMDQIRWIGGILGWKWPEDYLELLRKHDGVTVRHAQIYNFYAAFQLFALYHESWQELRYWPVAGDGCGNSWVIALREEEEGGTPVYFLDHEQEEPELAAKSLAAFVVEYMESELVRGDG